MRERGPDRVEHDGATVRLFGCVDSALTDDLARAITAAQDHAGPAGEVIIECAQLEFADSGVLGVFASRMTVAERRGQRLELRDVNEDIRRLLRLVRLDDRPSIRITGPGETPPGDSAE